MKFLKVIITLTFILAAYTTQASDKNLVLTCDFTTSYTEVIVDYPIGCSKNIKSKHGKLEGSRYLNAKILFLAEPPLCPKGYKDSLIKQGGRTSSGHANQTNSYQVRRICFGE